MAKLRNAGFVLMAVLFLALSWGCTADVLGEDNMPGTFEGLSAEMEMEIKRAYLDMDMHKSLTEDQRRPENVYIEYFGVYKGNFAVLLNIPFAWSLGIRVFVRVGDVTIEIPNLSVLLLWKPADHTGEGMLFFLEEAYDSGLLTLSDAREIDERIQARYYKVVP